MLTQFEMPSMTNASSQGNNNNPATQGNNNSSTLSKFNQSHQRTQSMLAKNQAHLAGKIKPNQVHTSSGQVSLQNTGQIISSAVHTSE